MTAFLLRRAAQALVVVAAVVFIVFGMMFLSGDPALVLLPPDTPPDQVAAFRHQMGFDQPFAAQFLGFTGKLLAGDFGQSWRFQRPALPLVMERLPATLELAAAAMALSLLIAVPAGILSAVKRDTVLDGAAMVVALLGQSIPSFWLGIMLILLFAVDLHWLPTSGRQGFPSLVLPAVSLGLALTGRNARLIRSSMLEVLNEDYVRTARAKGVRERRVMSRHAFRNALLPVVTVIGLDLGHLLGGTVIVETVFSWPGVGLLAVQAIGGRDYPVVQAVIIVSALLFTATNLLVDLLYTWLDPRIALVRR